MARGNTLAAMVKGQLADNGHWGYFALNGKWICPFCLNPVTRRGGKTREDSIAMHLESCRSYKDGQAPPQQITTIAKRQQFENIVHLADTEPTWRVYDASGCWFCPACLVRVPSVRTQGPQLNSFVYQAIASHLDGCQSYRNATGAGSGSGTRSESRTPMAVRSAPPPAPEPPSLTTFVQQQMQTSAWTCLDANGVWICPCCLAPLKELRISTQAGWKQAPPLIVAHLANSCVAFAANPMQWHSEMVVRKAADLSLAHAARQPLPTPGDTPITALRVAQPAKSPAIPTGLPAPPAGENRPATTSRRVARPLLASRTPLPFTMPTPPKGQGSVTPTSPPIAHPVGPPTKASLASEPSLIEPSGSLFGQLKNDFMNDTPLGALMNLDHQSAPPAPPVAAPVGRPPTQRPSETLSWMDEIERAAPPSPASEPTSAQHGTGSGPKTHTESLSWMDEVDSSVPASVPTVEREDMIKAVAVQARLMQKAPTIPGFRCAAAFEPCADISGDFYQYIPLPDGRIGFALGDVSGHGVQAGLIMSMAKKTLEIFASTGLPPAETLAKVNEALYRDLNGALFISMVYALLDPVEHTITWARAGHNPSLRFNHTGNEVEEIKPPGMVVGMKSGATFRQSLQEQVTYLKSGDIFLLYTDGITETMNLQNEEFGPERLIDVVRNLITSGPVEIIDRIMEILRHFRGPRPPSDDSTILILAVD